jgi:hypothetical protein
MHSRRPRATVYAPCTTPDLRPVAARGRVAAPALWKPKRPLSQPCDRTDLLTTEATWSGSGRHAFSADIADARRGYFRAHFEPTESFRGATSEAVKVRR